MTITTLFFDIGGVLLTNGWDHGERREIAARFGLDGAELESRHAPLAAALDTGQLSLDDYLNQVIFQRERAFSRDAIRRAIYELSRPNLESLGLLRRLAAARRWTLAALNNESAELNQYRIETFQLADCFQVFCSSCYLGVRKPEGEIYRKALGILQKRPAECVFIDDRAENLTVPASLGVHTLPFQAAEQLEAALRKFGVAAP